MTAVDHAELKRLAEGAKPYWGAVDIAFGGNPIAADLVMPFAAEISPAVVLALLSEIEGLKAERDGLRAGVNTLELERKRPGVRLVHLQRAVAVVAGAATRTQAPDSWRPDSDAVARVIEPDNDFIFEQAQSLSASKSDDAVKSLAWNLRVYHRRLFDRDALRPQTAESGK